MTSPTLYILTPSTALTPATVTEHRPTKPGDVIADVRGFPVAAWLVREEGALTEISNALLPTEDYWTVARSWFERVTREANLQNSLEIAGHGFWWTLNSQRFVPGLSDWGNMFAWIDLITAIAEKYDPTQIQVAGQNAIITHLLPQIFPKRMPEKITAGALPTRGEAPRQPLLIGMRIVLGLFILLLTLIRKPEICFLVSTNLLRPVTNGAETRLHDIYMGELVRTLARKRRVVVVEKYGANASWAGLQARLQAAGRFFPSDFIFLLAAPLWRRLGFYSGLQARWRRRWQSERERVAGVLRYRGYDLAPLLLPLVRAEFLEHGPNLALLIRWWQRILRRWQPRVIYVNNSYSRTSLPVVIAARSLGIVTVEQQHGMIGRNHFAYLVPDAASYQTSFPLCEWMVVWGRHTRRFLVKHGVYAAERLFVGGFPRIDALLKEPRTEEARRRLQIAERSPVVLYTSNAFSHAFAPAVVESIGRVPEEAGIQWIIKLHPREDTREEWQALLDAQEVATAEVVQNEVDFYTLLSACDLHVGFASTTIIESAILGKLNLGLDARRTVDPAGYGKAGAFLPVRPEELGKTVQAILSDPERRAALLAQQKAFATEWCFHQENAVPRIVTFIERVAQAGQSSPAPPDTEATTEDLFEKG